MEQRTLSTGYLPLLSVANHDGVTQQIADRLTAFETENPLLVQAIGGVNTARASEDVAFKRFSAKDFASDDLKYEDSLEDNYMSAIRGVLNGLAMLPENEPLKRKAAEAVQVFKDFRFSTTDGFEAEARKTLNMCQEWTIEGKYELDGLGIRTWVEKANTQAQKVVQLVAVRVDNEAAKVKGELATARKVTDQAIRQTFDLLNVLNSLQPSAELTQLINVLLAIEERARKYYISSGTSSNGQNGSGSQQGGSSDGNNGSNGNDENNGGGSEEGGSEQGGTEQGGSGDDSGTTPPSGGGGFPGSDEVDGQGGGSGDDSGTTPPSGGGGFPGSDEIDDQGGGSGDSGGTVPPSGGGGFGG